MASLSLSLEISLMWPWLLVAGEEETWMDGWKEEDGRERGLLCAVCYIGPGHFSRGATCL
jgi:hypothetical protein